MYDIYGRWMIGRLEDSAGGFEVHSDELPNCGYLWI